MSYCEGCNTHWEDVCGEAVWHRDCPRSCGICGKLLNGRNTGCKGHPLDVAITYARRLRYHQPPSTEPVATKLFLSPEARDELFTTAALEGLSQTDVVNRAIGLYAAIVQAKKRQTVSWFDVDNQLRVWKRIK